MISGLLLERDMPPPVWLPRRAGRARIPFQRNPKTGGENDRDGEPLAIIPVKEHVERLKALGWKLARKQGAARSMKRLRVAAVA
jgi:hypothetical protein